ncbi:hypothetical protein [Paludisphaera borealis]|uniref:Uncharacterized protein n=1 Tax=Paludisphaera borealis TaxID=1387353 RepID=A0A1U7CXR6_9BACT|nr:hypothetical protein [Paludisphaera borealis]APW63725.1 hypothetical protein BSF38_05301 [Paludisphaera borealis]
MLGFLRIFCLVGLPIFAIAVCSIWKPVRDPEPAKSVALRVAWTIVALMASVFLGMSLLFPLAAWLIWKPTARPKSVMDRVAWTVFAFGICLMVTMALFALTQEGDGDWRSWDRIRLHTRVFHHPGRRAARRILDPGDEEAYADFPRQEGPAERRLGRCGLILRPRRELVVRS